MKRSKGMTLVELLIAMRLSAMIMASTFVIVQFSSSTYDSTSDMIVGIPMMQLASLINTSVLQVSAQFRITEKACMLQLTVPPSGGLPVTSIQFALHLMLTIRSFLLTEWTEPKKWLFQKK